jgi:hypothetical protein
VRALPKTKVCVGCSTAGAYRAVSTTEGTGDNTWNDIQVLTPDQYDGYEKAIGLVRDSKKIPKFTDSEIEFELPLKQLKNKKK